MQLQPFKRAILMMQAISLMMKSPEYKGDLSSLGQYKSRGHGLGKLNGTRTYKARKQTNWQQRHAGRVYGVDYGLKECARRRAQIVNR